MKVSRRDFIKYCIGSATALGLDLSVIGALENTHATGGGPPIIWINAANCTGCTVSLANRISPDAPTNVADLLISTINLAYHPNLMGAAGEMAVEVMQQATRTSYILAVDGGIPTAFNGATCYVWSENGREVTALEAVRRLASRAKAVLCIGTCASFGGIPAGKPNPTNIKSVKAATGKSTINIPGCPAHPDWVVGTIAQLLSGKLPKIDSYGRPTAYFGGSVIHDQCPRKDLDWATGFGMEGCLRGLGCKGVSTRSDCPTRKWNNQTNWCIGANSICLGCTEQGFPDHFSPFYSSAGALPAGHESVNENQTCLQCHEDGDAGSGLPPNHPDTNGQSCSACHDGNSGSTLPPGHRPTGGQSCSTCHDGGSDDDDD